ncbi:RNA polymerase RNAP1 subunit A protein [Rhizobium phage RHph_I1_6]|uniref:RNA polymerase RNAP1 subunit A protein n=1 Tax=Rhizobium phage RHph_I1_6 TaxID=2509728 RepID=A0A7S5V0Y2_9CAUD|nr:RNA polymerase RNAP1 subunit A protein [Rhizobium phage RHph_I1_6]QIG76539.1 RNA polymerase RNAP1 subunit A protein [Rhizobium phage RHph_I1_6]
MALTFNAPQTSRSNNNQTQERPRTEYWLNIGIEAQDGTFVALPNGLPLDTMEPRVIRGSNEEWNALQAASNSLLAMILEQVKELAPGQEEVINGLSIQVKRVKADAGAPSKETNPFLIGFQGITAKAKPEEQAPEETGSKRKSA